MSSTITTDGNIWLQSGCKMNQNDVEIDGKILHFKEDAIPEYVSKALKKRFKFPIKAEYIRLGFLLSSSIAMIGVALAMFGYGCFTVGYMYHAGKNPATTLDAPDVVGIDTMDKIQKMAQARGDAAKKICGTKVDYHWTPDGNLLCATSDGKGGRITLFDANFFNEKSSEDKKPPVLNMFSPKNLAALSEKISHKKPASKSPD